MNNKLFMNLEMKDLSFIILVLFELRGHSKLELVLFALSFHILIFDV
jgi:hypothetical protein